MNETNPGQAEIQREYTFIWLHPQPEEGRQVCIMQKYAPKVLRKIKGISKEAAQASAENTPIICEGCRRDYKLKQ